jgi:hypothetical protein
MQAFQPVTLMNCLVEMYIIKSAGINYKTLHGYDTQHNYTVNMELSLCQCTQFGVSQHTH